MYSGYLLLIVVTLVLGLGSQAWINAAVRKWSKVQNYAGMTGYQAARSMLDSNGLQQVGIQALNTSDLADHYDPTTNMLGLSRNVFGGTSVASIAIACHEAGHAVQHAQGYVPARVRLAIFPAVNLASQAWLLVFLAGIFLGLLGLVQLAIILFAVTLVFQLVTLPVEFDASRRGLAVIDGNPYLDDVQRRGAKRVLTAAAFTYVAAALASALQLLYMIGLTRD